MKLSQVIAEANAAVKVLKDPKRAKMLAIAFRHDHSVPHNALAKLGPKPTDEDIVKLWSELLDQSLNLSRKSPTKPNLSADGRFDDWLTRLYINGAVDFEDINGEGGDALWKWLTLHNGEVLKTQDQDFNRFEDIRQLSNRMSNGYYRGALERLKNQAEIQKLKKFAKMIIVYKDDRFTCMVPLNYGATAVFNNAEGFQANFCTGGSSGISWFRQYAPDGIIVCVLDADNVDTKNGKWQFHAATRQIVNAQQDDRNDTSGNDQKFAELFPGLMKKIIAGIEAKADEIHQASDTVDNGFTDNRDRPSKLVNGGYDIPREIQKIQRTFPISTASTEPGASRLPGTREQPGGEELR
jgi:hypothetical protein